MLSAKMIGNRIAEARKKKGISQAQLAQQLFISSQAVGKWERGESMPDILTLNRLAEILGVDLNYFSENFQSAGNETANKANEEHSASSEKEMLNNFSGSNLPASDFKEAYFRAIKTINFEGARMDKLTYAVLKSYEADLAKVTLI